MTITAYVLSIIGIVLFPVSALIINYFRTTRLVPTLKKYKAYTSASKKMYATILVFGFIATAMSIGAFFLIVLHVSAEASIVLSIVSLFLTFLSVLCFYDISFNYEAVDNHYVYKSRFGKTRRYKIEDVNNFVPFQSGLIIQDKMGQKLFTMSITGSNVADFFKSLDAAKTNQYNNEEINQENPINIETGLDEEETALLEEYGKKYQALYLKNFNRNLAIMIAALVIVFAFALLVCYQLSLVRLLLILLILFVLVFITIIIGNFNTRKQIKAMGLHDLGLKGYRCVPGVKGYGKMMRRKVAGIMSMAILTGVFALIFTISPNEIKVDYSSLKNKTGSLTAMEIYVDDYQYYIGISLDDEMVLYSAPTREMAYQGNASLYNDFAVGQTIVIHYQESDDKQQSSYYEEKVPCYSFYYISINGETYYDEADRQAFFNYYNNLCLTYSIILYAISGLLIAGPLIYFPISKKQEKNETVEIFKK
ncbi:MAG TPA: hypothetical protein PKO28_04320 [Bacilli bacterium]|nr:hypothetical protein [Bacilli bacterium]